MSQKSLSKWLKSIIIGVGMCGLIVYGWVIPQIGGDIVAKYPEFSGWYRYWLVFLWATGVPCCAVLALGWQVAGSIGADRSFIPENGARLAWVSRLAAGDAGFLFIGNVVLLLSGMNHPGVFLGMLPVVFAGVAIAVAAACLSHLVQKAADLQAQSDLTI